MLLSQSDPRWVEVAISDIDALLIDHANCERKAAGTALSLIAAYPERFSLVKRLSSLAIEELRHFRQVCILVESRGLELRSDYGAPYAKALQALSRTSRHQRLIDRLLVAGLIEARSHERFCLLADALQDRELSAFYRRLARAEEGHAALFVDLASEIKIEVDIHNRLVELAEREAEIVQRLPLEARIH